MERSMWTDQRLDDLAQKVDAGFERVDRGIRELRTSVNNLWGSSIVGFLVVIATIIATN